MALAKLKDTTTNDTLTEEKKAVLVEPYKYPTPAIFYAIEPKSKGDEEMIA